MSSKECKERVLKELDKIQNHPDINECFGVDFWDPDAKDPDPLHWQVTLVPPKGTLYEGGFYKLEVKFPPNYPNCPPRIKFLTKIYHCNIGLENGEICLSTLKEEKWKSTYNMIDVLNHITVLLYKQNAKDPMNWFMVDEYTNKRNEFEKKVKEYIDKYAKPQFYEDTSKHYARLT